MAKLLNETLSHSYPDIIITLYEFAVYCIVLVFLFPLGHPCEYSKEFECDLFLFDALM